MRNPFTGIKGYAFVDINHFKIRLTSHHTNAPIIIFTHLSLNGQNTIGRNLSGLVMRIIEHDAPAEAFGMIRSQTPKDTIQRETGKGLLQHPVPVQRVTGAMQGTLNIKLSVVLGGLPGCIETNKDCPKVLMRPFISPLMPTPKIIVIQLNALKLRISKSHSAHSPCCCC